MRPISAVLPRGSGRRRLLVAAALLAAMTTRAAAQQPAQYEIAVSSVAVEPAAPAAGQRATLSAVVRIRPLTPVSRPVAMTLRVRFARTPQGEAAAPAETTLGEQTSTMRIGDVARASIAWLVEPGNHSLVARVEVLPGQRIDASDVRIAAEQATALSVPDAAPARPTAVDVLRPQNSAEPNRTVREPSAADGPPSGDRQITTAALGIVGARDPATAPASGLVIEVPLYVLNALEVRAVVVRCSVFAQTLGDLIGTGQAVRPVAGGTLAEIVAVAITPRPGRARSRAVRYSCLATYTTDGPEEQSQLPGGPGATAARRSAYERRSGRIFVSFSDLIEGEIDPR